MMSHPIKLLPNVDMVPSIHGRLAFAMEVRRLFLARRYGAVAVELPPSLACVVKEGVERLPVVSCVVYRESPPQYDDEPHYAYLPIDPCDSIIEAIRMALGERIPLAFVDREQIGTEGTVSLPDEHAVEKLGLRAYYQAVRPAISRAREESDRDLRERHMAARILEISRKHASVLFVCGMAHAEGIRWHLSSGDVLEAKEESPVWIRPPRLYDIRPRTLVFALGELPYQTGLYERCRASWELSDHEITDGVKELLLESRERYGRKHPDDASRVSPHALQTVLTYIRNLCLVQSRLTPFLYEIVVAAKGVLGGPYARIVAETSRDYPYLDPWGGFPSVTFNKDGLVLPEGPVISRPRLPGRPVSWREVKLDRPPAEWSKKWRTGWNPYFGSCSWPPEDFRIEGFAARARQRARQIVTRDLQRIERFQTSMMDGIDVRETLRNWHKKEIYVKVSPPAVGQVGAVIFVFDTHEERYPTRMTWHAEHQNESTIACYATGILEEFVGPGIARARYGGSMFLFPPLPIPEVWEDPRFDLARDAVERISLAALFYSRDPTVAYVAAKRPSLRLRELARKMKRRLVFVPLAGFSPSTVRKLRVFHILNGKHVRSWAGRFIG